MARLLWRDAQGKEGMVVLARQPVRIGRAPECEIRTEDALVSRIHARVVRSGPNYTVEDLGSANGSFFQETPVSRHVLQHGDAVRCGSLWLRFIDEPAQSADAAPSQPRVGGHTNPPPAGKRGTMVIPVEELPSGLSGVSGGAQSSPSMRAQQADAAQRTTDAGNAAVVASMARNVPSTEPPQRYSQPDMPAANGAMQRRIEQLQVEVRALRAPRMSGEQIRTLEKVEAALHEAEIERDDLRQRLERAEANLESNRRDVKVQEADAVVAKASVAVGELHDALSSLRVELIAATDEFEQFAGDIPRASFELIRQALRDAAHHADTSRKIVREMDELDDDLY